jgi:organic hydroperoxide reductase OsmC/OhrA
MLPASLVGTSPPVRSACGLASGRSGKLGCVGVEHVYVARCSWRGSTGEGYHGYGREHDACAPPAGQSVTLSAAEAFLGRREHLNPEQLVVMAAASCQLLSFLAVASRARVDVLAYEDEAEGIMPEDEHPVRLTRIVLRPRIIVAAGPSEDRVRRLVELAHRECYIANPLRTQIHIEPQVDFRPGLQARPSAEA